MSKKQVGGADPAIIVLLFIVLIAGGVGIAYAVNDDFQAWVDGLGSDSGSGASVSPPCTGPSCPPVARTHTGGSGGSHPAKCGTDMPFCTDPCLTDYILNLGDGTTACKDTDGWPMALRLPTALNGCSTNSTGFVPAAYTNTSDRLMVVNPADGHGPSTSWEEHLSPDQKAALSKALAERNNDGFKYEGDTPGKKGIKPKPLEPSEYLCRKKCRCGPGSHSKIRDFISVQDTSIKGGWKGNWISAHEGEGTALTAALWTHTKDPAHIGVDCAKDIFLPDPDDSPDTAGTESVSCIKGQCITLSKAEAIVLGAVKAPTVKGGSGKTVKCPNYTALMGANFLPGGHWRPCRVYTGAECPNDIGIPCGNSYADEKSCSGGGCTGFTKCKVIGGTLGPMSAHSCSNIGNAAGTCDDNGDCANDAGGLSSQPMPDKHGKCGDDTIRKGEYTWLSTAPADVPPDPNSKLVSTLAQLYPPSAGRHISRSVASPSSPSVASPSTTK